MLGLLLCGEVSGGHINPAVTVALATLGKFPWRRVPHYLAAQYLGAFLASAAVFLVYWDALVWYEHDRGRYRATPDTAAIFGTYPAPHLTLWGGVGDQLLGTGLLLLCVCAITDRNNMRVSRHVCPVPRATCDVSVCRQLAPFFVGLTILAIGVCFGFNCGYAINPARDFAPRLFSGEAMTEYLNIYPHKYEYECCQRCPGGAWTCSRAPPTTGGWSPSWPPTQEPSSGPGSTTWP